MPYDYTRLLLDEQPLQVLPGLACRLGLNEALILQQLHYLLLREEHVIDGVSWAYNSYPQWQKVFPFWGLNTIIRAIAGLEENGFIRSQQLNRLKQDRTKWYTIVYEKLGGMGRSSTQNGLMHLPILGSSARVKSPEPSRPENEDPPICPPTEKKRRVGTKRAPGNFMITPEMRTWALNEVPGINLGQETASFLDYEFHTAHRDWVATWRNWLRKAWKQLPPAQRRSSASPNRLAY